MDQVLNKTVIQMYSRLCEEIIPYIPYALAFLMVYLLCKLLSIFWCRILGPMLMGEVKWSSMGEWAVVAGASYGIGGHYARNLAKRGCNVFIIGHDAVSTM